VPPDTERLALVVKRQLQAVGVEMNVREASRTSSQAVARGASNGDDGVHGWPHALQGYGVWHSRGSLVGGLGGPLLDTALDRVRHASTDDEYRGALPMCSGPSWKTRRRSSLPGVGARAP